MEGGSLHFFLPVAATTNNSSTLQSHPVLHNPATATLNKSPHPKIVANMSAQPENQPMEGVQDPATDTKGKGKAPEADVMEESMDDDSSDESGVEDQVRVSRCGCSSTRK